MPELGYVVYLLALSYALGHLWYGIIDYRHDNWMRIVAYPFLGIVAGETFVQAGPTFFGVHVLVAFIATLVAALVDRGIHALRPSHEPSMRPAHA